MNEIKSLEDRLNTLEHRVYTWEQDAGWMMQEGKVQNIKNELADIRKTLDGISTNDQAIRDHVTKVESDFYDDGMGLKYKLIELFAKVDSYIIHMTSLESQLTFWGKWIVGLLTSIFLALMGLGATYIFKHMIK